MAIFNEEKKMNVPFDSIKFIIIGNQFGFVAYPLMSFPFTAADDGNDDAGADVIMI